MNSTLEDSVAHLYLHGGYGGHGNHTGHGGHGSHSHGGAGSGCKTEMLWNWNTIDSCFLTSSWRITSTAMFAGSCVGVFLLTIIAVVLRRLTTEYDMYIARELAPAHSEKNSVVSPSPARRPNVLQQLIRSLLYLTNVSLAYILMLLVMYYNGYIIISILAGFFVGFFACEWRSLGPTTASDMQQSSSHC